MVKRTAYLDQLISMRDKKVIKVVTGIRRAGKSTLLLQYIDYLKEQGVEDRRIVYINLESAKYDDIESYQQLYSYVEQRIRTQEIHYVIIDEIQNVEHFEKAVNSLQVDFNVDLYLTGSNAKMLSSELATLLSGRYLELRVFPFSFKEYYQIWHEKSKEDAFQQYLKYGGFPFVATEEDAQLINNYLDGIYNTIVLKDVVNRNAIKDVMILERLLKMVMSSIGSPMSSSLIAKALKNENRKVSNETIDRYLKMFEDAFIIDGTSRFDIKGKEYLKTLGKYYVADMGLRNHILGFCQIEPGHALENIVYMELLRRGYAVDTGKVGDNEIDFVARTQSSVEYYQVSYTVNDSEDTLNREIRPFNHTLDHNMKILLTMDRDIVCDIDGIRKYYIVDWLLDCES